MAKCAGIVQKDGEYTIQVQHEGEQYEASKWPTYEQAHLHLIAEGWSEMPADRPLSMPSAVLISNGVTLTR